MALSSSELADLIKSKVDLYRIAAAAGDPSDVSYIFDAIAEAIVEHITAKAEVRVAIVGLDLGAILSTELGDRFITRGDVNVPGALIPDIGLQTDPSSGAPTTAAAVSVMISTPGFID